MGQAGDMKAPSNPMHLVGLLFMERNVSTGATKRDRGNNTFLPLDSFDPSPPF
jgi:hypothetical protein